MSPQSIHPTPRNTGWFCLCLLVFLAGCRTLAPIHVWQPGVINAPRNSKLAIAPLAGNTAIASRVSEQLLAQRPAAKSDVRVFTAEQLAARSPIRLASTASLSSDLTASKAAQAVGANLLLHGEIVSAKFEPDDGAATPESQNMNEVFFQRMKANSDSEEKDEKLLVSWRVMDVDSGETLGDHMSALTTAEAKKKYPDLAALYENDSDTLIAATAREAWQALAPVVNKEKVELANTWLQPGFVGVRLGVRAAKKGDWERAEKHWQRVASWFPWSGPAQHNLSVALAAREDFPDAKERLQKATGIFAWNLPGETLFWLDQKHRQFNSAHGLPDPPKGWAFPDRTATSAEPLIDAPPVDLEALPWWTAIPLTKPPHWSWQAWLRQPLGQ